MHATIIIIIMKFLNKEIIYLINQTLIHQIPIKRFPFLRNEPQIPFNPSADEMKVNFNHPLVLFTQINYLLVYKHLLQSIFIVKRVASWF